MKNPSLLSITRRTLILGFLVQSFVSRAIATEPSPMKILLTKKTANILYESLSGPDVNTGDVAKALDLGQGGDIYCRSDRQSCEILFAFKELSTTSWRVDLKGEFAKKLMNNLNGGQLYVANGKNGKPAIKFLMLDYQQSPDERYESFINCYSSEIYSDYSCEIYIGRKTPQGSSED